METELKKLWEKTLNIIKGELTEVSFNTWIKSCEPLCISANTIKISVPNSFTQDILEKRYKDLVINSMEAACSKTYNLSLKCYLLCFLEYYNLLVHHLSFCVA